MSDPSWISWVKNWRPIAEKSTPTKYLAVVAQVDGEDYEVLRVSRYHPDFDSDTPRVEITIREFNDKVAQLSRATRDLSIPRAITLNKRPVFMIEPGGQVLEWRAASEGLSERGLVQLMRAGDIGRRVRRRDRKAAKKSQEQYAALLAEIAEERTEMKVREAQLIARAAAAEAERDAAVQAHARMVARVVKKNTANMNAGKIFPKSGTEACALGTAQDKGRKITSSLPLPGHYGG